MMFPVHIAALLILQTDDATASASLPHSGAGAVLDMVRNSGPVAIAVLVLLLIASLYSWAVILGKGSAFRKARTQSRRFARAFRKANRLQEIAAVSEQFKPSPLVTIFDEVYDTYRRQTGGFGPAKNLAMLERAAMAAASESLTVLERRLAWLATIGAVAPFVGLFGTVMGIVDAFHGLGMEGAATLRAVAPGVSEALITTAAGLLVAIPAVIAYNQFTASLREFASRMDDFSRELSTASKKSVCSPNRIRWRGRPRVAFTASSGHTRTSLAEINITPLVDVVLVLLIIFMVTAPVLQSGIDVSVPKTRTVKEITQQRMVLTIDRDQNVFLGDKPVNLAQLPTLLHQPNTRSSEPDHLSAGRRAGSFWRVRLRHGRGQTGRDQQHQYCDPAHPENGEVKGDARFGFQNDEVAPTH